MNLLIKVFSKFISPIVFIFLFFLIGQASSPKVDFFGAKAIGTNDSRYYELIAGDFDGDGNTDILSSSATNVFVYFGGNQGEFPDTPTIIYSAANSDKFPVAGDFNNDGRSDIAFYRRDSGTGFERGISVYLGNSDQTFSEPLYSMNLTTVPQYFSLIDFDLDGKLDLIGSEGAVITFCKGDGNGQFTTGGQLSMSGSSSFSLGDFDNDLLPDVLFYQNDNLYASKNMGGGVFGTPFRVTSIPNDYSGGSVGDINGDGKEDIISIERTFVDPEIDIWLGNGNFSFTHTANFVLESSEYVYFKTSADLNNDLISDLVFSSRNRTIIVSGAGGGAFEQPVEYIDGGGGGLLVKDFNFDGWLDIFVAQSVEFGPIGSGKIIPLWNLQNGFFRSAPTLETGTGTKDFAVTDFNGDDLKDFVVVNRGSGGGAGELIIVSQQTASNFNENPVFRQTLKTGGSNSGTESLNLQSGIDYYAVVTGDFDQDNNIDIIAAGAGAFGKTQNTMFLRNTGGLSFADPVFFQIGSSGIYDLASADVNSDGKPDLIATSFQGVTVSLGTGTGGFMAPVAYLNGIASSDIVLGDFNNDAKTDIAVASYNINKAAILINNGSGVFTNTSNSALSPVIRGIGAADFNGDGKLDLAAATGNALAILTGNGDGTLNSAVIYPVKTQNTSGITIADFNGDQKPDAALLSGSNVISILINSGFSVFGDETLWSAGTTLQTIASSDLNNDQKTDLILGFTTSSNGYTKILFNTTPDAISKDTTLFDFDGDSKTDISIFRPSAGEWWYLRSSDGGNRAFQFGSSSDKITPADFTGDGKTDIAIFRPESGEWFILRSEDHSFYSFPFGASGDIPTPADFDRDGLADVAIFRPSTATWFIIRSSDGGTTITTFGATGDQPVAADYDGDGFADIAVFRPSDGSWWLNRSSAGLIVTNFGTSSDKTVQADYTGDGKTDIAIWRPSSGEWFILRSENFSFYSVPFGTTGDVPAPGDYDGDGITEVTVFRPSTGTWYINGSTSGTQIVGFGAAGDRAVPNAFVR